jgi:Flp pilus assembly protein TadG
MAIVAPVLILLLFGIIDMGLLLKDQLLLGNACREAARVAAVGKPTADIVSNATNTATTLDPSSIDVETEYRLTPTDPWLTLSDTADGSSNSAPPGSQIKVAAHYPHTLICWPIASIVGEGGTKTRTLHSSMVARRE